MARKSRASAARPPSLPDGQDLLVLLSRCFAWCVVATTFVFLLNNYLTNWRGWPGALAFLYGLTPDTAAFAVGQTLLYVTGLAVATAYVIATKSRTLRPDSEIMYAVTAYLIRACFWAVFFIGLADMVISFLRVEGLLPALFGDKLAIDLGRSVFRFPSRALSF